MCEIRYSLPHRVRRCVMLLFLSAAALPAGVAAQRPSEAPDPTRSGELFDRLAELDAALFDAIFARCEAEEVLSLMAADAEFYHDQSGFQIGDEVHRAIRQQATDCPRDQGVQRVLLTESLRAHPLRDGETLYGVVQEGVHDFVAAGASSFTRARFVHLWRRVDGDWKITRVLSFDHQSLPISER